jgi:hypothetical protein
MQSAVKRAGSRVVGAVSKRLDSLVCGPIPEPSEIALAFERGAKILTAQE